MPYDIKSVGGNRFAVVNTETGNVHSKATTKANAEAQVRLLRGIEHGMVPRTTREVIGGHHSSPRKSSPSRHGSTAKTKPTVLTTRDAIGTSHSSHSSHSSHHSSLSERREARKSYEQAKSKPLGEGSRFKAVARSARAGGARNPEAVAAAAGIKAHGKAQMAKWARAGKARS